ncbi:MAG: hypothetical protein R3D57_01305 [Hyphomicrobiaceae bacterium]
MNETAANPEKLAKAKEMALGFIDQAWINTLTHPMVIFILVFALAVLFLARTGLWRSAPVKSEAVAVASATVPSEVKSTMPAQTAVAAVPPVFALPVGSGSSIETLIAQLHAETTARTDRALALSEEALNLHAAALDQLTRMNDALNRLVAQVDGATAAEDPV